MKNKINFSDPVTWVYLVVGFLLLRKFGGTLFSLLGNLTGITVGQAGLLAKQQADAMQVAIEQNPQEYRFTSGMVANAAQIQDDAQKLHTALITFWTGGVDEPTVWRTLAEYTRPTFAMCVLAYKNAYQRDLVADIKAKMTYAEYANLVKLF